MADIMGRFMLSQVSIVASAGLLLEAFWAPLWDPRDLELLCDWAFCA
jgi:hypothetical protein